MKNSNPIFSIKNFRSFGEEGADFELAPITVLTGCNSAGKSSLVKALMLLSNQHDQKFETLRSVDVINVERIEPQIGLDINSKSLMLGKYDKILYDKAKDGKLYLSYQIWSDFLQDEVIVKRSYIPDKSDVLNNGILSEFIIEKKDGSLIYEFNRYDDLEDKFGALEESYNRFIAIVNYYCAREWYDIDVRRDPEMAENYLKSALENINKYNVRIEDYNEETIKRWDNAYTNIFLDKEKLWNTLPEKEQENILKAAFLSFVVNEVINPWFIKDVDYINSSSALVKRIYSGEEDNKIGTFLKNWHERSKDYSINWELYEGPDVETNEPGEFLNKWIKKFNIGDSLKIEGTTEGLGFLLYLEKEGKKRLLADEGYGVTQLVTLLLQIDNNILMCCGPNKNPYENNDWKFVYPPKVICVEEPEVHLHPKYQSLLAEMFVETYKKFNIHFIIETHSEYLIRKLQVMVADKEHPLTSNDVSLNYVEKDENGVSTNRKIEILEDGRLSESFGPGFFDEADMLAMELLKYKARRK